LRRINIPKKKPTNTKMCSSVDMMEDISSTIKDNQEDNGNSFNSNKPMRSNTF
jgi:hypothetical protein